GAHETRRGRFALAGKGTIFLDEIGDTSLDFCRNLVRVIQDRECQRVGAERTEKTEARVLAATHQNLEQMVADKRFREDLYYPLSVVELVNSTLPATRSGLPLIAKHMVKRAGASLGTSEPVLSDEALDRLIEHHWPGNVRELENCVLRAVVIAAGNVLRPEHLSIASPSRPTAAPLTSLEQIEREHLTRVLAA